MPHSPDQDFNAALSEIRGNIDIRRLMFIFMHVLLPASVLAAADASTGSDYPPELAWLPRHGLAITGALVAACGAVTCVVLTRCHFGLVVNSLKLQQVQNGDMRPRGLNWGGVTTNFVGLCALSTAAGLMLLLTSVGTVTGGVVGAAVALLAPLWLLRRNHHAATALAKRLSLHWEHQDTSSALRERHATMSLEDCNADTAIIVTMAAALFAGLFGAMANIGGIPRSLDLGVPVAAVKSHGVSACAAYLTAALLLSARMILRLRFAVALHSERLARLRNEPDNPWRFHVFERTFLLYLLVTLLLTFAVVMLAWALFSGDLAAILGPLCAVACLVTYVLLLRAEAAKAANAVEKPIA